MSPTADQIPAVPTALIDRIALRNGCRVTLRPVLPQDAGMLRDFIAGLSAQTRRLRFHGAVKGLTAGWLQQMTCVDFDRHLALVATAFDERGQERIVGEARYVRDAEGGAEFALVIAEHLHGQGLGATLLRQLNRAADLAGVRWLRGEVLADNQAMRQLAQALGFADSGFGDGDTVVVERRVERPFAPTAPRAGWLARAGAALVRSLVSRPAVRGWIG
jgi:acetyltransferase